MEVLGKDGDRALFRTWQLNADGTQTSVLAAWSTGEPPAAASLDRLSHEYGLKDQLDSAWAVRPLELARQGDRTVLVFEDPGGEPLERQLGAPFETDRFVRLAISIAAALGEVHRRGLVHKDLKPAHILIDESTGSVRLTGFGLATRLPRERQSPAPPETIAGTLAYMAPEQTGRMNRSIDARSDLYSLGITFYQMLTGSLPFTASEPMEWIHCHIARKPVPPSERVERVPAQVSRIVMKLLAKTAEDRYQTAVGLEHDLRRCWTDWEAIGRIAPFPLGKRDIPDQLLIPEKLYGRESEIATLLTAFDRVVNEGTPGLVLVSGYSGIGKSAVVNELHKVLVPLRGLFSSGKFDQYQRNVPYATLAQAFQSLVCQLLGKSETELGPWRTALQEALGPNGQLIVALVPELALIIGAQPPPPDLPLQDQQARFQMVFRRFLSVFARPEHPLTLFLDDLQWLDSATLDLIEHLIAHPDVRDLLVVGAYRDNEVGPTHPLARTLARLRSVGGRVREIVLAPLRPEDVARLLADAVHMEPGRVRSLADLVFEKTAGNPFFTIQFLLALAEQELLAFDPSMAAWTWDLPRIRVKGFTDNVADLMAAKLSRLPTATQKALGQLACLGNVAKAGTLAVVHAQAEEATHAALWDAVRSGLILRSNSTYTFLHDRIREAAYALIPEGERAMAHLRIGRVLAAGTCAEDIEENIFEVVNQFGRGAVLISTQQECERVAQLNLMAGKRAKAATAYDAALQYFTGGRALLAQTGWEQCYRLIFDLEFNRAECDYLIGELASAEERLAMLSIRAQTAVDAAAVACARINLYTTLSQSDSAVEVGLAYLRRVGIQWSPHPTEQGVRQAYQRLREQLGAGSIEALFDLPLMRDPERCATMDVLTVLTSPALFTDLNLFRLVVSQMATLSLAYGNCDGSCLAYAWLGGVLGTYLGDYQAGFRFGRLGLDLVEKHGLDRFRARVYLVFAVHVADWTQPLRTSCAYLRRAFEAALAAGDLSYAAYSCIDVITNRLATGDSLGEVEQEAEHGLEFARKVRFGQVSDTIIGQLRLVRMLRGLTPEFNSFNDAHFDEHRFEQHLESDPQLAIAASFYWIRRLQASIYANDAASAMAAVAKAAPLLWTIPTQFEWAEYHFYGALARAAHGDVTSAEEHRQNLQALAAHHQQLAVWAEHCPVTFANRAALVGAEIARLEGRDLDAIRLYEEAILLAREHRFIHNEALAHELAARFCAARGFPTMADAYLRNARQCYLNWGADGKVRQLDQRYPQLGEKKPAAGPTSTIRAPLDHLDLATVLKVSQAVSGEILLDKLLDTLMRSAIEHAGAERGLLILSHGIEQRIAAEAITDGDTIVVRVHDQPVSATALSEAIVQTVLRTQEAMILDDVAADPTLAADPYFRQRQARSVLCLPLVKQSKLIGVLYLENNLAPRVFTPTRIAVLRLVASQAAISLENALLYVDLQQENSERKRAEEALREREGRIRRLGDSNIIGLFFWDVAGNVTEANDAFLQMVGYSRQDLLSGDVRWDSMTPAEYCAADAQSLKELWQTGANRPYEKEYIRKDGRRVPVLIGAALLEGSQENGVAFVLDLSERKEAEAERAARRVAEAANQAKNAFLANMSHELRTPLNGILGYAQILRRDPTLGERQIDNVNVIQHSGEQLLTLINDILDFAKIEAGKLELSVTDIALAKFLRLIAEIIDVRARQKGLAFSYEVASMPSGIRADEGRLRQVLLNLLTNAVKFTDRGQVSLRVRFAPPSRLRFEVQDTGIGVSAEHLESIFQPFEQVSDAHRRLGGAGLGLTISRQFVRRMGSDIHVTSQVGAGSTFWFELDVPVIETETRAPPERLVTGYEGPRKRVLVVDDVAENRAMALDMLSQLGFDVVEAANGPEALHKAQATRPDWILTDIVMPEMDGLEVTRRVRLIPGFKSVPIIAMSASASGSDERKSLEAGANAFIPKPIDVDQLLIQIATLLKLNWIYEPPVASSAKNEAVAPLVAPPPQELEGLHHLARRGNMRDIAQWAERVADLDARYRPFADQLQLLAKGYQSKAILTLVERYLETRPGV